MYNTDNTFLLKKKKKKDTSAVRSSDNFVKHYLLLCITTAWITMDCEHCIASVLLLGCKSPTLLLEKNSKIHYVLVLTAVVYRYMFIFFGLTIILTASNTWCSHCLYYYYLIQA